MEKQGFHLLVRALVLAILLVSSTALAQDGRAQSSSGPADALAPLSTGFTYQGRLDEGGSPVNDDCDMAFRLYDQATGGVQVGSAITATVPITDGLFTVTLDFGAGAFTGDRRWLGIAVDCEEDGAYADLGRQELTAAPQALYAMGAPWSGLTGVPAGFADGVDDDTTYTAGEGLALNGTEFSAQGSPYANVVVVAQSGGDYASVQAAIDSITDAAEDNPYLVWVAPGVYSETVAMKPYVHLQGTGQEATVITSTVTNGGFLPIRATLVLTRSTSLRDLTVSNGGTGSHNTALMATAGTTQTLVADVTARAQGGGTSNYAVYLTGSGTGVTLQHVTGLSVGGVSNYGLRNTKSADVVMRDCFFIGRGGYETIGIYNEDSGTTLEATDVIALAEGGGGLNYGLYNQGGALKLHGGSFIGLRGDTTVGIYSSSGTTLEATDVTGLAENGSDINYGLSGPGADLVLYGGSYTGRGGIIAYGIRHGGNDAVLEATSVTSLAENGSSTNAGLGNGGSSAAVLRGGSFTGRGGNNAYGIYNYDIGTTLEATGVTALGEDGTQNLGLNNTDGAEAVLHGGSFTAREGSYARGIRNSGSGTTLEATGVTALAENGSIDSYSLLQTDGTVYLGVTQLDGVANWAGGTRTCFQVYDGSYGAYSCPP